MYKVASGREFLNPEKILKKLGISEGKVVGDLGCGASGYWALQSSVMVGDRGKVYAVDIMKSVLDSIGSKARVQGLTNIKTIWSNLEIYGATKIKDGACDFALLINILFQSKKHLEILKESARMLKKEGKLIVIDWKGAEVPFGPMPHDRLLVDEVKKLGVAAGLRVLEVFEAGHYHYGVIFQK